MVVVGSDADADEGKEVGWRHGQSEQTEVIDEDLVEIRAVWSRTND